MMAEEAAGEINILEMSNNVTQFLSPVMYLLITCFFLSKPPPGLAISDGR